jgi:hypothetical protein
MQRYDYFPELQIFFGKSFKLLQSFPLNLQKYHPFARHTLLYIAGT